MCIRFGVHFNADCVNVSLVQGGSLEWSSQCRYLGVYFVSGPVLDAHLIIPSASSLWLLMQFSVKSADLPRRRLY